MMIMLFSILGIYGDLQVTWMMNRLHIKQPQTPLQWRQDICLSNKAWWGEYSRSVWRTWSSRSKADVLSQCYPAKIHSVRIRYNIMLESQHLTCATRMPITTPSWCRVPKAPRTAVGEISPTYMGVSPVHRPQNTPMINLPIMTIS